MKIQIDTDIILRQLEKTDAVDIFNTIDSQREYLGKWLPFVKLTKEVSFTQGFVDATVEAPEEQREYMFTIRKNDVFIGLIGFKDTDRVNKKTEIGYWLSFHNQGNGIITKSVVKLCEFAFHKLEMNRVQIKCAVGNIPSKNVPKRLGFSFEGIERQGELLTGGIFTDLEVYSQLKGDL